MGDTRQLLAALQALYFNGDLSILSKVSSTLSIRGGVSVLSSP